MTCIWNLGLRLGIDNICLQLVANKVHEFIPGQSEAHILDIGCGDGLVAEALSARVMMRPFTLSLLNSEHVM